MFREFYLPRWLLIYGLCVPLALLLGYLLATPLAFTSYATVGLVLSALALPVLLRWHHALLIFLWNSYLIVFFIPGQPPLTFALAGGSFAISLLQHSMRREKVFFIVPSVGWSLVWRGLAAAVTGQLTAGIGGRAFGEEMWGAKKYLGVFGAIVGYFALVAQPVSEGRAPRYASIYFLSGITAVVSDLLYVAGPNFYFLYAFFPAVMAGSQVLTQDTLLRFTGVGFAAQSASFFMLARYGIRGVFDLTKPWRMSAFILTNACSLVGGYRSLIILSLLIFVIQFYFEGLFKSRLFILLLIMLALLGSGMVSFSEKLPLSVQRSLSILPLKLYPMAKNDAQATLNWRFAILKTVYPEIPKYFFLGKGFAYSGTDAYLAAEAIRRGIAPGVDEATLIGGYYHQGILTIVIPLGIWGLLIFGWFCWSALRVLARNYRYGSDPLRPMNTFLLSLFVGRLVFYALFYGQFDQDLYLFTGIIGLSIALNGGMAKPVKKTVESPGESASQTLAPQII